MSAADGARAGRPRNIRRRPTTAVSVALAVMLMATLSAYVPLLVELAWWLGCLLIVVCVNGIAAISRSVGARPLLGSLCGAVAGLIALTAIAAPATAVIGILPTPSTLGAFSALIDAGSTSVYQQSIPARADEGVTFLLTAGALLLSVTLDLIAVVARSPLPTGLLCFAFIVPPSLLAGELPVIAFVATGIAYAFAIWASSPIRRGGAGRVLVIGVAASALAGIAATTVPGFYGANPFAVSNASSFTTGVSPLIDLGKDLQQATGSAQFRYTTDSERADYFRLMTLETYDGTTWVSARARGDLVAVDDDEAFAAESGIDDDSLSTVDVTMASLREKLLPVPRGTVDVSGIDGRWYWDPDDGTVRSRGDSTAGQTYTISVADPTVTPEQLRASELPERGLFERERSLPDSIPEIITRTVDEVTADAETPYDKAYAMQRYLREGDFTYSISTPVSQGYDGDSIGVVATFLERRSGYCIHFAAAMATMARVADIPSRIVIGFLPGDEISSDSDDERREFEVDAEDLHAWPELYFEGVGWVPFEPTPGRSDAPDYAPDAAPTSTATADPEAAPEAPTRTRSAEAVPDDETETDAAAEDAPDSSSAVVWAFALALLFALGSPALVRYVRRRWRRSRVREGRDAVENAWRETIDTAVDHGLPLAGAQTPRQLARAIVAGARLAPHDEDALDRLCTRVERSRFGPERTRCAEGEILDDLDQVLGAIALAASASHRLKATLWPVSVFPRGVQREIMRAG
ncbi:transglutaminase TgpA family protein [Paramicrobacterium sp. CJ85]|uniref:transglutaminase TgpA family protein n=1 Tax=Paramicrobacterium sp. CJ85 TaxID=3445355 RepID=UPI003F640EF1